MRQGVWGAAMIRTHNLRGQVIRSSRHRVSLTKIRMGLIKVGHIALGTGMAAKLKWMAARI